MFEHLGFVDYLKSEGAGGAVVLGGIVAIFCAFTLVAFLVSRPKTPSFTFDLREKAGLLWGVGSLIIAMMFLKVTGLPFWAAIFAYSALYAWASEGLSRGKTFSRAAVRRGVLLLHAVVVLASVVVIAVHTHRAYEDWRPREQQRRQTDAVLERQAAGPGFPSDPARARARILLAESSTNLAGWERLDGPVGLTCSGLDQGTRKWLVCAGEDGKTRLVAVLANPRASADQAEALQEVLKQLMWVVDRGANAEQRGRVLALLGAADAARAEIPFGPVVVHVNTRRLYHYELQAPAPGAGRVDLSGLPFW